MLLPSSWSVRRGSAADAACPAASGWSTRSRRSAFLAAAAAIAFFVPERAQRRSAADSRPACRLRDRLARPLRVRLGLRHPGAPRLHPDAAAAAAALGAASRGRGRRCWRSCRTSSTAPGTATAGSAASPTPGSASARCSCSPRSRRARRSSRRSASTRSRSSRRSPSTSTWMAISARILDRVAGKYPLPLSEIWSSYAGVAQLRRDAHPGRDRGRDPRRRRAAGAAGDRPARPDARELRARARASATRRRSSCSAPTAAP